jgi:plasmid stabilization system protein ParE
MGKSPRVLNYVFSPSAQRDLHEAQTYLLQYSVQAADAFDLAVVEACEMLGKFPNAGRTRAEFAPPPAKFWVIGDYVIAYRVARKQLQIIAILHASRDIPSILSDRASPQM